MSKTEYAYTTGTVGTATKVYNYTYGNTWKDQLTAFDGTAITYDAAGNPTSYLGKTLTWSRGRLLTKYVSGTKTVDIQYDGKGIRVAKTRKIGTSVTTDSTYIYDNGGKLRTEIEGNTTRNYIYGQDGVVGYEENGEHFMYRKNFFGDITAIYQGATKIAEYAYDAWGNCTIVSDYNGYGARNPFRYRGYYFDSDLGMYYLTTRYYDPQTGRFINADTIEYLKPDAINGLNLYAYCKNNPLMLVDYSGTDAYLVTVTGAGGLPIVGHSKLVVQGSDGKWYYTEYTNEWVYENKFLKWLNIPSGIKTYIKTEEIKTDIEDYIAGLTGCSVIHLPGDYTQAADVAIDLDRQEFGDGYDFFKNNCAHYVEYLLQQGKGEEIDPNIAAFHSKKTMIPMSLHNGTKFIQDNSEMITEFKNWWGNLKAFFGY